MKQGIAQPRWLAIVLLLVLVAATDARMAVQRHGKRQPHLIQRQISIGGPNPNAGGNNNAASTNTNDPATPPPNTGAVITNTNENDDISQTTGGILDSILDPLTSAGTSNTAASQSTASSLSDTVNTRSSTSSATSASSRTTATSASEDVFTTEITSTASIAEPSTTAQSQNDDDENKSSGVGKKTLIIIISVASAVGLVAAIWTLLRKWKFSPSRKFNERLNPIDWNMDSGDADAKMLMRTPSNGSNANSLNRHNSFGSAQGSVRGGPTTGPAMSERGGVLSEINGGYGASTRAPPMAYHGAVPAYPPGFGPNAVQMPKAMPQHSLMNPYEHVTRQPTVSSNGGRYGEGYGLH